MMTPVLRGLRATALLVAAAGAGCGSDSSTPTAPPGGPATGVFAVFHKRS